jgi:hypothetical protein
MKPRQLIAGCFARIFALGVALTPKIEKSPKGYRRLAYPETLMNFLDERMIVAIGDSYRQAHAGESRAEDLESLIMHDASSPESKSSNEKVRRKLLQNKIRDDFAHGRLLQVDGWLLSKTEARQCALFSIETVD